MPDLSLLPSAHFSGPVVLPSPEYTASSSACQTPPPCLTQPVSPSSLGLSCPGLLSPCCADGEASFLHPSSPLAFRSSWSNHVKTAHLSTPFSLHLPTHGASLHARPSPVSSKTGERSPQLEHGNPCDQHPGDAGPAPGGPSPEGARGGGRLSTAQHLWVVRGSVRNVSFASMAFWCPLHRWRTQCWTPTTGPTSGH